MSIIEATCDDVKRRNIYKVGLLGTIFTMNGKFFKKPFTKNHIDVITTTDEGNELVNMIIDD